MLNKYNLSMSSSFNQVSKHIDRHTGHFNLALDAAAETDNRTSHWVTGYLSALEPQHGEEGNPVY